MNFHEILYWSILPKIVERFILIFIRSESFDYDFTCRHKFISGYRNVCICIPAVRLYVKFSVCMSTSMQCMYAYFL